MIMSRQLICFSNYLAYHGATTDVLLVALIHSPTLPLAVSINLLTSSIIGKDKLHNGFPTEMIQVDIIFCFSDGATRLYEFFHAEWTPPEMTDIVPSESVADAKRPKMALAARVKTRPQRGRGAARR